jgi:OOP family OmpA-OmpF porin
MIGRWCKRSWWVFLCISFIGCAGTGEKDLKPDGIYSDSSYSAELQRRANPRDVVPVDMTNMVQKVDNFLVIFDPSASMSVSYGNRTKFELAMDTVLHFNRTIPALDLVGGMRTFGHPVYTSMIYGFVPYSPDAFENALLTIENTDGVSPMEFALEEVGKDFFSLTGKTAIIIFSDGQNMDLSPILAARKLVGRYPGRVCIYTILVGDDPVGKNILADIATEGDCGFSVHADSLVAGQEMADFVKKVFLAEAVQPPKGMDADGDGVMDDKDDCPNTPGGLPVDALGCWKIGDVLFDFDKYDIKPDYFHVLDAVAGVLARYPEIKIQIEGHTDIIGPERYNDTLSINRGNAGKTYLINKGVPAGQITVKGFGYSMPRDTNQNIEGRSRNRRIEFRQVR